MSILAGFSGCVCYINQLVRLHQPIQMFTMLRAKTKTKYSGGLNCYRDSTMNLYYVKWQYFVVYVTNKNKYRAICDFHTNTKAIFYWPSLVYIFFLLEIHANRSVGCVFHFLWLMLHFIIKHSVHNRKRVTFNRKRGHTINANTNGLTTK